ncbi:MULTISPECIES: hypothetical protein [Sphingobacterium]|uniref:hypothetical protein n=1 Tax=Sphingobacterium TaxID=28453 RepID=UPI0012E02A69|nr:MULTISPECIES: hypothetical protein [Sphingobacterium]
MDNNTILTTNSNAESCLIVLDNRFTSFETSALRSKILEILNSSIPLVHIDASNVSEIDLSGVNEIIHSNYALSLVSKKMNLIYHKTSPLQNWASITGFSRFISSTITI